MPTISSTPNRAQRGSGTVAMETLVGVALFIAAATTSVAAPRLSLILTFDSPGVNEVFIPAAYWAVVLAVAAWITRLTNRPFHRELARAFVVGFAVHMLLLLGLSAARNLDRAAYPTGAYWLYARGFYGVAVAASMAWVAGRLGERAEDRFALVAVGFAAASLAVMTVWRDPAVGVAAVVVGIGSMLPSARMRMRAGAGLMREWRDDDRVVIGIAFALSLGLRLLYTMRVMSDPNYLDTGPDARVYDQVAWQIVNGGSPFLQGYPLLILGHVRFLAGIYWLFGHSYLAACVVQSLIGAAAVAGLYVIAKPLFGSTTSLIATVFAAVNFQLTFWAAAIGYQALDIGLTVFLVWLLIRAVERWPGRWAVWALAGVTFGFAISVRETSVTFFVFACAWVWWTLPRPPATRWSAVGGMSLAAVITLVPLVAPMVATPQQRMAMRGHFDRLASGSQVTGHEGLVEPMSNPAAAADQLRKQPQLVLRGLAMGVVNNITRQFMTQPYGAFDMASLRKGTQYYYGVWCYAYLLTVVGGIVVVRRIHAGDRWSGALTMVLGVIISRSLVHLYLQSGYRHRAPLEPFLILLCAAGLMAVLDAADPKLHEGGIEVSS